MPYAVKWVSVRDWLAHPAGKCPLRLPPFLFDHLRGGKAEWRVRYYPTCKSAHAAVGAAKKRFHNRPEE